MPSFGFSWPLDVAWSAAQLDSPLIHDDNKVRDELGNVVRFESRQFWIEGINTGPGAYSDTDPTHISAWPTDAARKGYIFGDLVRPGAVPLYDDPSGLPFGDLFDPADVLAEPWPRLDARFTTTVPDPGVPEQAPRLTAVTRVFGGWVDERQIIEDTYPTSHWGGLTVPASDSIDEHGIPAVALDVPGQGLREWYIDDPALDVQPLGVAFPGAYLVTLVLELPRSAIGQQIAFREVQLGPSIGRSPYYRAANSTIDSATWAFYVPTIVGGTIEPGDATAGVRRHSRRVLGNAATGVTLGPGGPVFEGGGQ